MNHTHRKVVADYEFGETIADYGDGMIIVHATKVHHNQLFSIYCIPCRLIPQQRQTLQMFYDQIVKNDRKIYPKYVDMIRTKNNVYVILQDIVKLVVHQNKSQITNFVQGLQRILFNTVYKVEKTHIFMINDPSRQLCLVPKFGNATQPGSSNLYTHYYNVSAIAQTFIDTLRPIKELQCKKVFLEHIKEEDLASKILHFVYQQDPAPKKSDKKEVEKSHHFPHKSILDLSASEYPEIDQSQFLELTTFANVNAGLKEEANKAYMTASNRASYQQTQNSEQMIMAVQQIKKSVMKEQQAKKEKKSFIPQKSIVDLSKIEDHSNENLFDVYYEMYMKIFDLLKLTSKSYLQRYPKGYSGILAAYLLCLVGIFKRLKMYEDLYNGFDIFEIGLDAYKISYQKYLKDIRQQLAKERSMYVRLKEIIENMQVPYRVMEIIMPYIEDDLEMINPDDTKQYCFFFMAKLLQIRDKHQYHEILALQTMEVLLNEDYSIIYDSESMPKHWDKKYYNQLKIQIQILKPGLKF